MTSRTRFLKNSLPKNLLNFASIFVLLLGWMLITFNIEHDSLWQNEIISFKRATQPSLADSYQLLLDGNHAPLYELGILRPFFRTIGHNELIHRLPSALFSLLTIAVGYRLMKEMFDKRTALLSAIFLAINPVTIYYAREGRMYALLALLILLTIYLLFKSIKSNGQPRYLFGYALCAAASLYTHYYAGLTLLAISIFALAYLIYFKQITLGKRWFAANIGVGLLFAPWLTTFIAQLQNDPVSHIQTPSVTQIIKIPGRLFTSYYSLPSIIEWGLAFMVFVAIILLLGLILVRFGLNSAEFSHVLLLTSALLGTLALAFLVSILVTPIVGLRYFTGIAPLAALLAGLFVAQQKNRTIWPIMLAGVLVVNLFFTANVLTTVWRKDYRAVSALIAQKAAANETVILYSPSGSFWLDEFEYYYDSQLPVVYLLDQTQNKQSLADAVQDLDNQSGVWVIQANQAGYVHAIEGENDLFKLVTDRTYPSQFFFTAQAIRVSYLKLK